jgi:hypothetical protein
MVTEALYLETKIQSPRVDWQSIKLTERQILTEVYAKFSDDTRDLAGVCVQASRRLGYNL